MEFNFGTEELIYLLTNHPTSMPVPSAEEKHPEVWRASTYGYLRESVNFQESAYSKFVIEIQNVCVTENSGRKQVLKN